MKFWIGALAEIANVTVLWAQLIVDGESKGPHPFLFPIRCKKSHKVLPGVIIRDCGIKRGLNYIDNRSLILEDVRIPKSYLLRKYGYVDDYGKY
jgi:acyl-CoA oxidase